MFPLSFGISAYTKWFQSNVKASADAENNDSAVRIYCSSKADGNDKGVRHHFLRPRHLSVLTKSGRYRTSPTLCDRASILHALSAKTINGLYQLENERKHFVSMLYAKKNDPKIQHVLKQTFEGYVQHYVYPNDKSIYTKNALKIFHNWDSKFGWNKSKEGIAKISLEACMEAYSAACQLPEYCFTENDLPLVAYVFSKTLEVHSKEGCVEYQSGNARDERIVLVERLNEPNPLDTFPCFQRCEPYGLADNLNDLQFRQFTSPKIQALTALHDTFLHYLQQGNRDVFPLIFDYAELPIASQINDAVRDIFARENWSLTIKSEENWAFIERFRHRVTTFTVPNAPEYILDRVQKIVSLHVFPNIEELRFPDPEDIHNDHIQTCIDKLIDQNPRCISLAFHRISLEQLYFIFKSRPHLAQQLQFLEIEHLEKSPLEEDLKEMEFEKPSIRSVFTNLPNLKGLLIKHRNLKDVSPGEIFIFSDVVFEVFPQLRHLDLGGGNIISPPVSRTLEAEKAHLKVLDLQRVEENRFIVPVTKQVHQHTLRLRNCIYAFNRNLVETISQIETLEELDIRGIRIKAEDIHLLANLKNLRVFKCGNTILSSEGSYTELSGKHVLEAETKALQEAVEKLRNKNLEIQVLPVYRIVYYVSPPRQPELPSKGLSGLRS